MAQLVYENNYCSMTERLQPPETRLARWGLREGEVGQNGRGETVELIAEL